MAKFREVEPAKPSGIGGAPKGNSNASKTTARDHAQLNPTPIPVQEYVLDANSTEFREVEPAKANGVRGPDKRSRSHASFSPTPQPAATVPVQQAASHLSDITAGKVGTNRYTVSSAASGAALDGTKGADRKPKGERERQRIRYRGLNLGQLGPDVRTDFRAVLGLPRGSPKSPSKSATHC